MHFSDWPLGHLSFYVFKNIYIFNSLIKLVWLLGYLDTIACVNAPCCCAQWMILQTKVQKLPEITTTAQSFEKACFTFCAVKMTHKKTPNRTKINRKDGEM